MIKPKSPPGSERLKSFADRINRLLDEKQEIGADIGDIYTEAKSAGYVPKVLRKAIARQRMDADKRQEEDSILELYEAALDGPTREAVKLAAQGASAREIEAATGIDQATVARSVSLKKKRETHKSTAGPEQDAATIRPSSDDALQAERTDEPPATPVPDGGVGAGTSSERPALQEVVGVDPRPDREPKPIDTPIDLTIPTFLDQRRHA